MKDNLQPAFPSSFQQLSSSPSNLVLDLYIKGPFEWITKRLMVAMQETTNSPRYAALHKTGKMCRDLVEERGKCQGSRRDVP